MLFPKFSKNSWIFFRWPGDGEPGSMNRNASTRSAEQERNCTHNFLVLLVNGKAANPYIPNKINKRFVFHTNNGAKIPASSFTHSIEHHHCYDSKMPRTCPIRVGDNDCNATHNKHHQCRHNAQIGRETKTKEGYVKLREIIDPNGNGVKDEKRHLFTSFNERIPTHTLCRMPLTFAKPPFLIRKKKASTQTAENTYYNNVKNGQEVNISVSARVSVPVSLKKWQTHRLCSNKVTPVIKATQRVSIRRSSPLSPKTWERSAVSYFAKCRNGKFHPRGTIRLAAYDTKQHTRSLMFWDTHPTGANVSFHLHPGRCD